MGPDRRDDRRLGHDKHWSGSVMAWVRGTRQDALDELEARARRYRPFHPRRPRRGRLFRHGDGFLLVTDGRGETFHTRSTVAELLHDSEGGPSA